jgi:predicted aconitase with swiveling domain
VSVATGIVIRGRCVVGGVAEGEALVTSAAIPGWGGVDPGSGTVIETGHALHGVSFSGKVLVCRGAKGSSGWSSMFHTCRLAGTAPLALVFNEMTTKIALGAVVMGIPSVTELETDPLTIVRTGDRVRVDADRGLLVIERRAEPAA